MRHARGSPDGMLPPERSGPGRGTFAIMQSTRPRELGALILAIGVLLVLFVVTLALGAPLR
jgi:hypothetical protein